MPQLDFAHYPFLSQFFWLFTSFIVLYVCIAKIILPRISKVMEVRDVTIKDALKEAENLKNEANSFANEFEDSLNDAKIEANRIITTAQNKIKAKTDATIAEVELKISKKISDSEKNIKSFIKNNDKAITKLSDEIYNNLTKKYTDV